MVSIVRVILPDEIALKARAFAAEVFATTDYRDCSQTDARKILHNHYISKIGEEAVATVLRSMGKEVKGPDYTIYQAHQKSWASDLYAGDTEYAVKSQGSGSSRRYGLSWTFALNPRRDPILDKPDAIVYMVEVLDDEPGYQANVYPPKRIKELDFQPPAKPELVGHKLVVYAPKDREVCLTIGE